MIEFVSVGDYPNGYQLGNDELEALAVIVARDPSCNYAVREMNVGRWSYHLEVTATHDDEDMPPGPSYTIADGIIKKKSRVRIIKDEDDGDTVFEVVGGNPLNQTNAITFAQAIELANEWAA